MFKEIVTNRFKKLAKDSWTEMHANPQKLGEYWKDLSKGKIPEE